MKEKDDFNGEKAEESAWVGRVTWDGKMVDIKPAIGFSLSEMPTNAIDGPIDDIYRANDITRFEEGEHLGYVYCDGDGDYDLRVP